MVLLPHEVFAVTTAQLAHRSRIAQIIAPLKRVRPRVPFWYLGAHRIPTLWILYRGLLKNAPDDDVSVYLGMTCDELTSQHSCKVRWRVRRIFEQKRVLTSPTATKQELLKGYCVGRHYIFSSEISAHFLTVVRQVQNGLCR